MTIEKLIISITGYSYNELHKALPDDVDKQAVTDAYETIIRNYLKNPQAQESPFLINVSGIPGTGKTTFCQKLSQKPENTDAIYIGFDAIMENKLLPYIKEEADNPEEAFARWELSARIAGYELLRRATEKKQAIIFEHSSALPEHLSLFRAFLREGYKVHFYHLNSDVESARQRIRNRKRHIPTAYIDQRNCILQELLPEYRKICTTFKEITQ